MFSQLKIYIKVDDKKFEMLLQRREMYDIITTYEIL